MAFVPAPNIVQVELRGLLQGQHIENRWMFDCLGPPTEAQVNGLAALVDTWAIGSYFPLMSADLDLVETVATDMSTITGYQFTLVPALPVHGGNVANSAANANTLAISLKSNSRGRSANGRSYVLSLPSNEVSRNSVTSGFITGMVTAFQSLIDDADSGGTPMVIVSYRTNNAPRPGGPVYFPVVRASVYDGFIDSQRRRKPGNGT